MKNTITTKHNNSKDFKNLSFNLKLILLIICTSFFIIPFAKAQNLTGSSPGYTQNFDALSSTGTGNNWVDNSTISSWYSDQITYDASTGSSATGGMYSFGIAGINVVGDRALGALSTGTKAQVFGVKITNSDAANDIISLTVSYFGEQWRQNISSGTQKLYFEYQIDPLDLSSGIWTAVTALDFTVIQASATGPLEGNAPANRIAISAQIPLTVPTGHVVWLRWRKANTANSPGLAIDDLTITATYPACEAPTLQASEIVGSNVTCSKTTLTWTSGNGTKRIVVAKQGSSPTGTPVNGTNYSANANFGTGNTIATGEFVVYNGTGSTVTVSGLTGGILYGYKVFEYNCSPNNLYNSTSGINNPGTQQTSPPIPATPGTPSGITSQDPNTTKPYSITAVTGATSYLWTVPTGWSISAGQGTTSISVLTGSVGQNGQVCVSAINACGSSTASCLDVVVETHSWVMVSAGAYHTLGLGLDGKLFSWGLNNSGQLGIGSILYQSSFPKQVTTPSNSAGWSNVSAGYNHSLGVKSDGTLWAWGDNSQGQLGINSTTNKTSPVQVISGSNTWKKVFAGAYSSFGIKADGSLWAWGNNDYGKLGDGTIQKRLTPVAVTTVTSYKWVEVATGFYSSYAINSNGELWSWGFNAKGELGIGNTTSKSNPVKVGSSTDKWLKVAAGQKFALAIKNNNSLWAWGLNANGQLGDGTTVDRKSPKNIAPTWAYNWISVSAGEGSSYAINSWNKLYAWGKNADGQLGIGSSVEQHSPVLTGNGINISWVSISGGYNFAEGIKLGQYHYCGTGKNTYGQLGNGSTGGLNVFVCQSLVIPRIENPDDNQENNKEGDFFIDPRETESIIRVFPNPSNGKFTIQIQSFENTISKIQLNNLIGEQVFLEEKQVRPGENSLELITNTLPDGIYLLKISAGEINYHQKILINK